jgi:hypothetical protein
MGTVDVAELLMRTSVRGRRRWLYIARSCYEATTFMSLSSSVKLHVEFHHTMKLYRRPAKCNCDVTVGSKPTPRGCIGIQPSAMVWYCSSRQANH